MSLVVVLVAGACGDDSGRAPTVTAQVRAGAAFCSVYAIEYKGALNAAVPATHPGFDEAAQAIVAWANVLDDLALPEVVAQAKDNVRYHQAQADKVSAADFIPGSNAMHAWAAENCS